MPTEADAMVVVDTCKNAGAQVRLIGSLAVALICGVPTRSRPEPPKDIDIVGLTSQRAMLQPVLADMQWLLSPHSLLSADLREQYRRDTLMLDVFYDGIDGNHRIDLRERLAENFPTISATDLLLSKLQRVKMRDVDVWDVAKLLECVAQQINLDRWRAAIGCDWGLYTTVTDNLARWRSSWPIATVDWLADEAAAAPKTIAWKARNVLGRSVRWWTPVYVE